MVCQNCLATATEGCECSPKEKSEGCNIIPFPTPPTRIAKCERCELQDCECDLIEE